MVWPRKREGQETLRILNLGEGQAIRDLFLDPPEEFQAKIASGIFNGSFKKLPILHPHRSLEQPRRRSLAWHGLDLRAVPSLVVRIPRTLTQALQYAQAGSVS